LLLPTLPLETLTPTSASARGNPTPLEVCCMLTSWSDSLRSVTQLRFLSALPAAQGAPSLRIKIGPDSCTFQTLHDSCQLLSRRDYVTCAQGISIASVRTGSHFLRRMIGLYRTRLSSGGGFSAATSAASSCAHISWYVQAVHTSCTAYTYDQSAEISLRRPLTLSSTWTGDCHPTTHGARTNMNARRIAS
jgi:hypothetical protein